MEHKNHTAEHIKAWYKKKVEIKIKNMFPNKSRIVQAKKHIEDKEEEKRKHREHPFNKSYYEKKQTFKKIY